MTGDENVPRAYRGGWDDGAGRGGPAPDHHPGWGTPDDRTGSGRQGGAPPEANGRRPVGIGRGINFVPLSPSAIRARRFRESSRLQRGYDRAEVDEFLSRIAVDVSNWTDAVNHLQDEIDRLKDSVRAQAGGQPKHQRHNEDAVRLITQAQQQADAVLAEAHAHARAVQADAREHAERITRRAQAEADQAARAYRARSGVDYSADEEARERHLAFCRSVVKAISSVQMTLDATGANLAAATMAFKSELDRASRVDGAVDAAIYSELLGAPPPGGRFGPDLPGPPPVPGADHPDGGPVPLWAPSDDPGRAGTPAGPWRPAPGGQVSGVPGPGRPAGAPPTPDGYPDGSDDSWRPGPVHRRPVPGRTPVPPGPTRNWPLGDS